MRARHGWERRLAPLAGALLCVLLVGCGQPAPAGAPWRGSHPDPDGYSFLEQGQLGGVCAISVHYPDEAPSAINRSGSLYLQRGRSPRGAGAASGDKVAGRSGDWSLLSEPGGRLALLTTTDRFEYEAKSSC